MRAALASVLILTVGTALGGRVARAGSSIGGGANQCTPQILDKEMRDNRWYPEKDPRFQSEVKPVLDYIGQKLPYLAEDMQMILSKPWYALDCRIAVNTSQDVVYASGQMADQDRNGIFIDRNQFDPDKQKDPESFKWLVLHELLQGIRIEKWLRDPNGQDIPSGGTAVEILNQRIIDHDVKNARAMQGLVLQYLKTTYATADQLRAMKVPSPSEAIKGICLRKNSDQNWYSDRYTAVGHALEIVPILANKTYFEKIVPGTEFNDIETSTKEKSVGVFAVPPSDKALLLDAYLRLDMKIMAERDNGFYSDPVLIKPLNEVCDEINSADPPAAVISAKTAQKVPRSNNGEHANDPADLPSANSAR